MDAEASWWKVIVERFFRMLPEYPLAGYFLALKAQCAVWQPAFHPKLPSSFRGGGRPVRGLPRRHSQGAHGITCVILLPNLLSYIESSENEETPRVGHSAKTGGRKETKES